LRKNKRFSTLNSVEVVYWCIPVDYDWFFAFGVLTNMILLDDFTIKTTSQRLFKGKCEMKPVWRIDFKRPIAMGASQEELGCSHKTPSNQ